MNEFGSFVKYYKIRTEPDRIGVALLRDFFDMQSLV